MVYELYVNVNVYEKNKRCQGVPYFYVLSLAIVIW